MNVIAVLGDSGSALDGSSYPLGTWSEPCSRLTSTTRRASTKPPRKLVLCFYGVPDVAVAPAKLRRCGFQFGQWNPNTSLGRVDVIYSAHVTKLSLSLSVRLNETAQRQVRIQQYRHLPSLKCLAVSTVPFWSISENREDAEQCVVSVCVFLADYFLLISGFHQKP
jgi:hypothetical protein